METQNSVLEQLTMAINRLASRPVPIPPTNVRVSGSGGGSVSVGGVYNSTPPTYTNGDDTELQTDVNGNLKVTVVTGATTNTISRVLTSTSSVTIKASNANRKELVVFNDSAQILYVKYGSPAGATDFTFKLLPDDHVVIDKYTGLVTGILDSGTGAAQVTEVV